MTNNQDAAKELHFIVSAIKKVAPELKYSIRNLEITWEVEPTESVKDEIDLEIAALKLESAKATKRLLRNTILSQSDWVVLQDSPVQGEAREAWLSYRQALREFTDQEGWLELAFPSRPGK
jgi:hypothetical protein